MINEMNHAEVAQRIEEHNRIHYAEEGEQSHFITQALSQAAADERRIANGELVSAPVKCGECRYKNKQLCPMSWLVIKDEPGESTYETKAADTFYCAVGERKDGGEK